MTCGANHKRTPTSLPPQPARPPAAPPTPRLTFLTDDHLTLAHLETIARLVAEVISDHGWGSVEIIVERGELAHVRKTTSQLFLDALLTGDRAIPHGDDVKK